MSSYSTQQLADHVRQIIDQKYGSTMLDQDAFRGRFNTLVKSISSKLLTDAEQDGLTLTLSNKVLEKLRRLDDQLIIELIPREILDNSRQQSFDISVYEKDMNNVAKTMIFKIAAAIIKDLKRSIRRK